MNLDLNIEELVLHGFPSGGPRIIEAVELRLAELIAERGLPAQPASPGDLSLRIARGASPERIGNQIAGAIYSSLGARVPEGRP